VSARLAVQMHGVQDGARIDVCMSVAAERACVCVCVRECVCACVRALRFARLFVRALVLCACSCTCGLLHVSRLRSLLLCAVQ
jgi:hypothetical protein